MASLTGNLVAETYKALLKTIDNDILTASEKQITDGLGGGSNVFIDSNGFLRANKYKVTNGLATQFLKADGSLDANTYLTSITGAQVITALGYTPVTDQRTLTINGVTYNLTANRSWTVAGTAAIWGNITGTLSNQTDLQAALNAKFNVPAGTISQYIRGDGSLATFPTLPGGLPTGGTAGQILAKINSTDYNTEWIDNFATQTKNEVKLGQTLAKGAAVYVSSADGTNIVVSAASNTSEALSSKTFGLLETGGSTNAFVKCVTFGLLAGLNTTGATAGDPVWLGVNGALIYGLANKPYAPKHLVYIGVVTRVNANNGEIFVNVQNGFELKEIHDVYIADPANNHGLFYDIADGLWKNKSIAGALGYTPQAQLNGTGFVKASGTTISYDNSTYLTTANAAATYLALTGGTLTGSITATSFVKTGGTSTQYLKADGSVAEITGDIISGAGSAGYVPKWTSAIVLGSSLLYDNGTSMSIGTLTLNYGGYGRTLTGSGFAATSFGFEAVTGSTTNGGLIGGLSLVIANNDSSRRIGSQIQSYISGATATNQGADLRFYVKPDAGVLLEIVRMTSAGITFNKDLTATNITATAFIKSGGTSSQFLMADGSVSTLSSPVTGSGSAGYIPKWTTAANIGSSIIYEDVSIGIAYTTPNKGGYGRTLSGAAFGSASFGFEAVSNTTTNGGLIGGLSFIVNQNDSSRIVGSAIQSNLVGTTATNYGADLRFFAKADGVFTISEVARMTSTGLRVYGTIVKDGGTSSQFLMADGSVTTGPDLSGFVTIGTAQTITGKKTFSNAFGDNDPIIALRGTSTSSFQYLSTAYNTSLESGKNVCHFFGRESALKNSGYIGFQYNAANSNINFLTLGIFGNDHILKIYGSGYSEFKEFLGVGINPIYKLQVYTDADVWHTAIGGSANQLRIGGQTTGGAVIQSLTPAGDARLLYLQRDGSNVIINGTTDTGDRLQVNGTTRISTRLGIGDSSAIYSLQLGTNGTLTNSIRIGNYQVPNNTRQYIGYARADSGLFEQSGSGDSVSTVLDGVSGIRIVNTVGTVAPGQADNSVQLLTHIYNGNSRIALHANFDGNVGIMNTSPKQRLHVSGRAIIEDSATTFSGYGTSNQSLWVGSLSSNGALTIASQTNGYAYLNFAQGGTTKFEIGIVGNSSNGSLYINRTPQTGETGASIYVNKSNGYVGINSITPSKVLTVRHGDSDGLRIEYTGNTDNILIDASNIMAFSGTTPSFLKINPGGGNVAIGTSTDSGFKLDVIGNGRFTGTLSVASNAFAGTINFGTGIYKGIMDYTAGSGLWKFNNQSGGSVAIDYFQFQADGNPILTIKKSGISTFISTVNATNFVSNITNNYGLVLNRPAANTYNGISLQTAGSPRWFIGMRENRSSNNFICYSEVTGVDVMDLNVADNAATFAGNLFNNGLFRTAGTSNIVFWASASQSASFGAVIGDSTTSRSAFFRSTSTGGGASVWWGGLDTSGRNIPYAAIDAMSGGGLSFWHNTAGSGGGAWTNIMSYNASGVQIFGTLSVSSSVTATSFFESSDFRLKTLIEHNPIVAGIENLQAKLYEKNGKIELGYFAQDAELIMPYAVTKGSGGFLSLSYREVHTAKIARLEKEVADLKEKLNLN